MGLGSGSLGCILVVLALTRGGYASEYQFEPFDTTHLDAERAALLLAPAANVEATYLLGKTDFYNDCDRFINKHYPWKKSVGKAQYSATVNTDLFLYADCRGYRSGAVATFEGRILNLDLALADANVEASAVNDKAAIDASFVVLNYEVARYSKSHELRLKASGRPEYNIQKAGQIRTSIGPMPVVMDFGVLGKADLRWQAQVDFSGVNVSASPKVDTDGYLLGGLSAYGIVEAKAGGFMKLIEDQVSIESNMGLVNRNNQANLLVRALATNEFSALAGRLNARLTTGKKVIYEKDFFNWDGVTRSDVIVEYEKAIPLNDIFWQPK